MLRSFFFKGNLIFLMGQALNGFYLSTGIIIQIQNSKKKMAYFYQRRTLRLKISEFQEANSNFSTKLEDLQYHLKFYPIEMIQEAIAKSSPVLVKARWMILLHNIMLQSSSNSFEPLSVCISMISADANGSTDPFDMMVCEKFIAPYKLYLQKRLVFSSADQRTENQDYQLINLIRKALSFTDVLFPIGRYLYKNHQFFGDFVTVIAKDLSTLYKRMKKLLTQQMLVEHAEIMEKMNEGLYNIYYNCYFAQISCRYAPVWINTEFLFKKREEKEEHAKLSPSKRVKEVQERVVMENDTQLYESSVMELEEIAYEPKSTSTIESNTDKDIKDQSYEMSSRREFLFLAETLLQEMERTQNCQKIIY